MFKTIGIIGILMLAGCGSPAKQSLIETWMYEDGPNCIHYVAGSDDVNNSCNNWQLAQSLMFVNETEYKFVLIAIGNNSLVSIETGTYIATKNEITFIPTKSSCPGSDPVSTGQYVLNGDSLLLSDDNGSVSYVLDTVAPATDIAYTYGCFDFSATPNPTFTPGSLESVSN